MHDVHEKQLLHRRLNEFYNCEATYFEEAHEVNAALSPERAQAFSWIGSGDLVLDVGCGPADNGIHIAPTARYIGCDLSGVALGMARRRLTTCRLAQGESQALPFATASFDVVLSTYALEHLVFPKESLEEMWRVCRSGGIVIVISPAYDDPRQLPPSTSHWTSWQRLGLMARQAWRQVMRHVAPGRSYFSTISQPRIFRDAYQSDFDAVHLVSAREVANFFRARGATFLFERKRLPRRASDGPLLRRGFEQMRNLALRLHLGEYAGLNLQIVVRKPA